MNLLCLEASRTFPLRSINKNERSYVMELKFVSWNVNGIRATLRKGFLDFFNQVNADFFCLQETKASADQVTIETSDYEQYWNAAEKKGYSGTAIFSKIKAHHVHYGLEVPKHDKEGRLITLEFDDFYLVNVYTPNARRELLRLDYRTKEWDIDFLAYLKRLELSKPVVFCGDLNVAHKEIDLANPAGNRKNAGFTDEERSGFDKIVAAGFTDTFREFVKVGGHYTWWSNFARSREKNIGWRIDYFCISRALRPRLKSSRILPEVFGSDHCPILMTIDM